MCTHSSAITLSGLSVVAGRQKGANWRAEKTRAARTLWRPSRSDECYETSVMKLRSDPRDLVVDRVERVLRQLLRGLDVRIPDQSTHVRLARRVREHLCHGLRRTAEHRARVFVSSAGDIRADHCQIDLHGP